MSSDLQGVTCALHHGLWPLRRPEAQLPCPHPGAESTMLRSCPKQDCESQLIHLAVRVSASIQGPAQRTKLRTDWRGFPPPLRLLCITSKLSCGLPCGTEVGLTEGPFAAGRGDLSGIDAKRCPGSTLAKPWYRNLTWGLYVPFTKTSKDRGTADVSAACHFAPQRYRQRSSRAEDRA